jgi:hypothetical protein
MLTVASFKKIYRLKKNKHEQEKNFAWKPAGYINSNE